MELLSKYRAYAYPGLIFIILILILVLFNFFKSDKVNFVEQQKRIPLKTKEIYPTPIKPEYLFFGRVVGKNEINIVSGLGGKIVYVSKKLFNSQEVKKEEVLFEIDSFNFEQDIVKKKSHLDELKIELDKTSLLLEEKKKQLNLAEEDLQRKKKLFGNTVSQKALDDSKLEVSKAKSEYSREEYKINSIKLNIKDAQANLKVARKNLYFTKYRAPFPGKVSENLIDLGSEIKSGEKLGKLINTSELEVKFFVGEGTFTELGSNKELIGKKIKLKWKNSKFKKLYEGSITKIDSTISENSAGLNMYASIDNVSEEDPIRPGVFVQVLLAGNVIKQAIQVPENAIYEEKYIYLLKGNKPIKLDVKVEGYIENDLILSGNFVNGSIVILTRLDSFQSTNDYYSIND